MFLIVIPAKTGTHACPVAGAQLWIPAFAGMTKKRNAAHSPL